MPPVDDMLLMLTYIFKILQWGLLAALVLWAIPSVIFSVAEEHIKQRPKKVEYSARHRRGKHDLVNEIRMNTLVTVRAART